MCTFLVLDSVHWYFPRSLVLKDMIFSTPCPRANYSGSIIATCLIGRFEISWWYYTVYYFLADLGVTLDEGTTIDTRQSNGGRRLY